jgi:toxin ParE1/3/4
VIPVVFSELAELDLEEIGDYIAADNPARAVSFVREIREHCTKIAKSPLAYVARPDLGEGIRCCTHGRYMIFFLPSEREVLVVRVIHGARDLSGLFEDEA